jgi:hypothetical protein
MSEPFLERLSRFTPDAGRLDRDALLFAAGRSSVRPGRGWMTMAGLLAGTQALSLVLLWPHASPPPAGGLTSAVASVSARRVARESPASAVWGDHGLWSIRRRLLQATTVAPPADDMNLIDSGPPLRAIRIPGRS